jgi:hypothetical protein
LSMYYTILCLRPLNCQVVVAFVNPTADKIYQLINYKSRVIRKIDSHASIQTPLFTSLRFILKLVQAKHIILEL